MKLLLIITFLGQLLFAAPAYQGKRTFTQPNGEVITYHLQGDQYLHWMEKDDGEIMVYNQQKKQMESAVIQNGELKSSGRAVSTLQRSTKASSQQTKISRKDLEALYKLQREEYSNRLKKLSDHHKKPH